MRVYTDGACLGNPGPGGWAYLGEDGTQGSGGDIATTNQRMELTAVLRCLEAFEDPLEVVSDSTYVVNCFKQRWWVKWEKNGWRNSKGDPVANSDLWKPLLGEYHRRGDSVNFEWVKGHSGHPMNEAVDQLAQGEARRVTGAGK